MLKPYLTTARNVISCLCSHVHIHVKLQKENECIQKTTVLDDYITECNKSMSNVKIAKENIPMKAFIRNYIIR